MISLVGRTLGDYVLELPFGAGSMGEVFRARHVRTGAPAAVKVMHARYAADPGFRERFREVAAAAAAIRHPHAVTIVDAGEQGGQFYIVMELLAAGSLRALLQHAGRPVGLARAVELVRQGAEGVHAGHAAGVVHRDVKPENLLLGASAAGDEPTVRVADFGLTRLAETGVTLGGNVFFGSPAYMSPELCKGAPLDARSDVYSLGVVLYEVATGFPPFQVTALGDAVHKHVSVPPPPPRSVAPDLPAQLEAVILRCLAKRPEERFASAAELAAALATVLRELPAAVRAPQVALRGGVSSAPPREPVAPGAPPAAPPAPRRFKVAVDDQPAAPANIARPPAGPAPAKPPGTPRPPESPASADPAAPGRKRIPVHVEPTAPARPARPPAGPPRGGPVRETESRRLRVVLDSDTLVLTPGQPAVVRVTLVNGGRTVDHYTVTVEGVPERWVQGPAAPPQLNPGERSTVALTVLVPRTPESVAREYPVFVRGRSRENPGESSTAPARWTVLPFTSGSLALAPARTRGWRNARFAVTLRNAGNAPATYALSGTDDEQRLRYQFAQPSLRLAPGESATVALRTRAPLRWLGGAEPRAFTVRAEPEPTGATAALPAAVAPPVPPPLAAPGQFVHRALIPTWLPPLLVLAAVAALFLLRGRNEIALAVVPARVQVAAGGTAALSATVTNAKGEALPDQQVTWSVRDTAVATVSDSGVVRGRSLGTTLVRVQREKKSATVEVEVVPARVDALAVAPRKVTIPVNGVARLRATARDAGGAVIARDVAWQSSDPTVATVGGDGRVVAKGGGSATITAMSEGKLATAEITVPAPPPAETAAVAAGGAAAAELEDCVAYDPAALRVTRDPAAGFLLSDGSATLATLDNESDARKALALARRYKSHCFLGRQNTRPNRSDYVIEHWKGASGAAGGAIDAEDCVPYDRATLRVAEAGAQGLVLADRSQRLLLADSREDARRAWEVAQRHDAQCFIGRGNRRPNQRDYIVQYWK